MTRFVVLFLVFGVCLCKIPDYINICKKDGNLSDCLQKNYDAVSQYLATNGEPMFKLQNLKSVHVDRMELAAGNLKIILIDPVYLGLENIKMDVLTMDDKELHLAGRLNRIEYTGKYELDGKILILPIQGQGDFNITHVGCKFDYVAQLQIEERKGRKYYYVNGNWNDTRGDLKAQKTYFQFNNLFGGDPRLGPEMNVFLNENNAEVFDEVKNAIDEGFAFYLFNPYINGFLRHIPIDNLFTSA